MLKQKQLCDYLNQLLASQQFTDYAPNGLQVAGKSTIVRLATAVTASANVIDKAIAIKADALLVHHGYFWRGENPCLVGYKQQRIKALLQHDMNLFAYHLPLDAHAKLGNNVQLGQQLGLLNIEAVDAQSLLWRAQLAEPLSLDAFGQQLGRQLQREPLLIAGHTQSISSIAWCTGAAQDMIEQAAELGVDAYLSGEVSERTYHSAKELRIHYIAAGHHATERYGVQALGQHLQQQFSLFHQFIDETNPV